MTRARVLDGWQSPTRARLLIAHTSDTSLPKQKKIGKEVGENRGHLYHQVCQHEFANFSLPCEGRFVKPPQTQTIGTIANHDGNGNENVTKQNGLMSTTIAVHVHYNSWFICRSTTSNDQFPRFLTTGQNYC